MSGENKFFFEEDAESTETGVSFEEQANIFGETVKEVVDTFQFDSMEPMGAEIIPHQLKEKRSQVLLLEYGIVDQNYAIHITPIHPQRNLRDNRKMNEAIKAVILELNKVVPFDLQVKIHLPQEDWEIKALSFVIEGGANAWNLDKDELETHAIFRILQDVSDICIKP